MKMIDFGKLLPGKTKMDLLVWAIKDLHPRKLIAKPLLFSMELFTLLLLAWSINSIGSPLKGSFGLFFLLFLIMAVTLICASLAEIITDAQNREKAKRRLKLLPHEMTLSVLVAGLGLIFVIVTN